MESLAVQDFVPALTFQNMMEKWHRYDLLETEIGRMT